MRNYELLGDGSQTRPLLRFQQLLVSDQTEGVSSARYSDTVCTGAESGSHETIYKVKYI